MGLKARTVLIAAGATVVALSATVVVASCVFQKRYTEAMESRSLAIATSLEVQLQRVLQLGLSLGDLIGFEEQCQEVLLAYPEIDQAMVVGVDGTILFHNDPKLRGQRLEAAQLLSAVATGAQRVIAHSIHGYEVHDAVVPVLDLTRQHRASIVVRFSGAPIGEKGFRMGAFNLGVGLLFLGVGILILVGMLSVLVTNPLEKLIRRLEEMRRAPMELSRRVKLSAGGEIGRLAEAFNGLMQDLEHTTVSKVELETALRNLRETEERYRRVVEASPSAIFVDCDDRLVFVNPSGVRLLGAKRPEELLGKRLLDFVHPGTRALMGAHFSALMNGSKMIHAHGMNLVRLDGVDREVEVTGIAFIYDGRPAVQMVMQDITESKATMAQLIAAGRMASLGTLARGVAHEINNPLTCVLSGLQFVAQEIEDCAQLLPEDRLIETLGAISDAKNGAIKVSGIVKELQSFSRDREDHEEIDLEQILDIAVKIACGQLRSRTRIVKDYGRVPRVLANEPRLGQVFINLLMNAGQAIVDNGLSENLIRIATRRIGEGHVLVEISDTGCGIPMEARGHVFDAFFTTRQTGKGAGLGLFIAHEIIRGMGGELTFESEPGKGTTFRVAIPLDHQPTVEDDGRTPVPIASGAGKKTAMRVAR